MIVVAPPCQVVCIQNGLQPIHHAAQEGKEEVVKLLVDKFNVKVTTTSNV